MDQHLLDVYADYLSRELRRVGELRGTNDVPTTELVDAFAKTDTDARFEDRVRVTVYVLSMRGEDMPYPVVSGTRQ